jgi:hypothetical protein
LRIAASVSGSRTPRASICCATIRSRAAASPLSASGAAAGAHEAAVAARIREKIVMKRTAAIHLVY